MRYSHILLIPFLLAIGLSLSAQLCKPNLTIRISHIETKLLIDTFNLDLSKSFIEASKVKVVHFELLKRNGNIKNRPKNFIVLELGQGDHSCDYNFVVGEEYTLPAIVTRYPNADIRMFKNWHYRIDCYDLPVLLTDMRTTLHWRKRGFGGYFELWVILLNFISVA